MVTYIMMKGGMVGWRLKGSNTAQTCAQSGYKTIMFQINPELLDKGLPRVDRAWDTLVSKGKMYVEKSDKTASA